MYKPKRDYRFEYVSDALEHIEEQQCYTCRFQDTSGGYAMCGEIQTLLIMEQSVAEIDDHGDDGLVCNRYEQFAKPIFKDN